MYLNLEAELKRKGWNKRMSAEMFGIPYNTLTTKLRGESRFTLDEVLEIKKILSVDIPIEYLFEESDQQSA